MRRCIHTLLWALLVVQYLPTNPVQGQFRTSFETGYMNGGVSWEGDTTQWQIIPYGADFALRSNGPTSPDTLFLFAASNMQFGTWQVTFDYFNGPLSNFNLARIYLLASDPSRNPESGLYMQLGGNARKIRLYHQENTHRRSLLAESTMEFFDADSAQVPLSLTRFIDGRWTLAVGSTSVWSFQIDAPLPVSGSFFGLWVKHTSQRGADFQFDALSMIPENEPVDTPIGPQPVFQDVVINEIMYAPDAVGTEFIEFYNPTDSTFDLAAFTITDDRNAPLSVSASTWLLKPDHYAVITRDTLSLSASYDYSGSRQLLPWPALNNNGDAVFLRYDTTLIDAVAFEGDWGVRGRSLERKDPHGPSQLRSNWTPTLPPEVATPGRINTQFAPDTIGPGVLFAERIAEDRVWVLWDEAVLVDSASLTLYPDNQSPLDRTATSDTEWTLTVKPEWIGSQLEIAHAVDPTGNIAADQQIRIAYRPLPGELLLNEMLFAPIANPDDGIPDQVEFIEIVNTGNRLLSLRHVGITEGRTESGTSDTLFAGVALPSLMPEAYAVWYASNNEVSPGEILRTAFPAILAQESPVWLPVSGSSLFLDNQADYVQITEGQGRLDAVSYDEKWHFPALLSFRGVSLERIQWDVSSQERGNWSSSRHPDGATPGYSNSVAQKAALLRPDLSAMFDVSPVISPDADGIDDFLVITYAINERQGRLRFRIFDGSGRFVTELPPIVPQLHGGTVTWNGFSQDGRRLTRGLYIVLAEYFDPVEGKSYQSLLPFVAAYR